MDNSMPPDQGYSWMILFSSSILFGCQVRNKLYLNHNVYDECGLTESTKLRGVGGCFSTVSIWLTVIAHS